MHRRRPARSRSPFAALAVVTVAAVVGTGLAGCGSDDDAAPTTTAAVGATGRTEMTRPTTTGSGSDERPADRDPTTTEPGAPTTAPGTTVPAAPGDDVAGGTARLTTSDGVDDALVDLTCAPDGDGLLVRATGPAGAAFSALFEVPDGPVTYRGGGADREGVVRTSIVGDDGGLRAQGQLTVADDGATPATFALAGRCPV